VTIGQLYNAKNVVVGQAAGYIAPQNTPLPALSYFGTGLAKLLDPFDPTPFTQAKLAASATLTAGTFTLTYTLNGVAYTTSSLNFSATAAQVLTALQTALAALNPSSTDIVTTGGPVSAPTTPIGIVLSDALLGGTWTMTPTGITGGTLSLTAPIWMPGGGTDSGWKYTSSKNTQTITIEEQSTPVKTLMQSQVFTIEAVLAEDISRIRAIVYNMLQTTVAPATGVPGYEQLNMTDNVIEYAVTLVMQNALGLPMWVYIPSCTCLANVDTELHRASAKRMFNAVFTSDCAIQQIQTINFVAPGT